MFLKFVKLVFSFNSNSNVCNIMKENKLLTIDQLLAEEIIVFKFKQKNGKNPIAFKDIFSKNVSKYNTRNKPLNGLSLLSLSLFQRIN